MDCCEFREKYSDYADDLLSAADASEARRHLASCPACRRFDAAFRAGVDTLRALPAVGVSRSFGFRLRSRLRLEFTVRVPVVAHWSGALGTLLLVATVGVVGWDLFDARTAHQATLALRRSAVTRLSAPTAVSASRPAAAMPLYHAIAVPVDAFHPLQSTLVSTASEVSAADGERPRYDLSVVWGGP